MAQYMEQRQRRGLGNRLMNLRTECVRLPPCSSQTPCGPLQVLLHILYTVFIITADYSLLFSVTMQWLF